MNDAENRRTGIRRIMRNLAETIRDSCGGEGWPDGVPAPVVYLDGIADGMEPTPEEEGAPVVVVAGTGDTGAAGRSDLGWSVEVLVALDCSRRDANALPSRDPGDGIREAGDGDSLEAVANAVTDAIRGADAGAVLSQLDRTWSFHTVPVQFCAIRLSYTSPSTFADVDDGYSTDTFN